MWKNWKGTRKKEEISDSGKAPERIRTIKSSLPERKNRMGLLQQRIWSDWKRTEWIVKCCSGIRTWLCLSGRAAEYRL